MSAPITSSAAETWAHVALIVGAVIAVLLGGIDLFWRQHLTAGVDLALIFAGLGALGIKAGGVMP